jgi:sugar lactone lactonase YvrE
VPRPITTVAGTGEAGAGGDGGPALQARFDEPRTAAPDGAGNLFVTDTYNHSVRRIDRSGVVTTVAGSGQEGFAGDGGPATAARLKTPHSVATGAGGVLFIADSANSRIRMVDAAGIITTIAGRDGDGYGGDGGPAVRAMLNRPKGIAIGPDGLLYIADSLNHRVRRIDRAGVITTVAGTGEPGSAGDGGPATGARLLRPRTLAFGPGGLLYILEDEGHRVRRVDPPTGRITTVAGTGEEGFAGDGGPAVLARLDNPRGIAADRFGNLYIADSDNNRIRRVDPAGVITTIAGTGEKGYGGDGGPATAAALNNPRGVVALDRQANVDADGATVAVLVVDSFNHRIRRIVSAGHGGPAWGSGDGGGNAFRAERDRDRSAGPHRGVTAVALHFLGATGARFSADLADACPVAGPGAHQLPSATSRGPTGAYAHEAVEHLPANRGRYLRPSSPAQGDGNSA